MTATLTTNHDHPIVVMSFNRPYYLEAVLKGLSQQIGCGLPQRSISLFQDGAVNPFSGQRRADDKDINACVQLFQKYIPQGTVLRSDDNIGIALNFDRAEKYVFETLNAEAAIFLEDDLEISQHYIFSLDHFLTRALEDERIGHVAVYGHHRTPLEEQQKNPGGLILLEHNWGFGLTRRQWFRNKKYVDPYVDLLRDCDYRLRDTKQIYKLFGSWGLGCPGDSQDVAKTLACCVTGAVKLNIRACLGKYIGVTGVHMKKEWYDRLGYESAAIYSEAVTEFEKLTGSKYQEIFNIQMKWATERPCPCKSNDNDRLNVRVDSSPAEIGSRLVSDDDREQKMSDEKKVVVPSPSEEKKSVMDSLDFVRSAYMGVLHRPADKSGLTFYAERLDKGKITPKDVIDSLLNSKERARLLLASTDDYNFLLDNQFDNVRSTQILENSKRLESHQVKSLKEFSAIFSSYSNHEYYDTHRVRLWELINAIDFVKAKIAANLTVLEFGDVFSSQLILKAMPELNLSTLDFAFREELNGLVKKQYQVELMKIDFAKECIAEERFDLILCCEVIEHLIVNPVKFFSYLLKGLKEGGFVYLTTPNFFKAQNINNMKARFNPQPIYPISYGYKEAFHYHVREYGMGELIHAAIEAGGRIYAYRFSSCWDDPKLSQSIPVYERSNLVLLVQAA